MTDRPNWFPSVAEVAEALVEHTADLPRLPESDDEGHPYRLQVISPNTWAVHVGDPSYDQDRHGYWGAAECFAPIELGAAVIEAEDLLNQASAQYWGDCSYCPF